MAAENKKRILEDASSENLTPTDDDSEWIGPTPAEAILPKKRKVLPYEHVYLQNLPDSESYEKSYMHRDIITHVATTKTDFLITASYDGHVKFWKKLDHGIEFVKHFRAHLGSIHDMTVSCNGEFCATVSEDKAMKVFDVINFDMINMIKLGYVAKAAGWIFAAGDPVRAIAVSEKESSKIYIYDGTGGSEPIKCMDRLHASPPTLIKFNPIYEVIVSSDPSGMLEYWTGPKSDYKFPKSVLWKFKTDTDLYEFAKCKSHPTEIAFSPNGKIMGILATDRKIRVFKFLTGKLSKVLDESLQTFTELQQRKQQLPNMEFGRRIAIERELEKSDSFTLCNLVFDQSSNFMMYATMLGIKVINLHSNTCVKFLGMPENARFIQIALFQGAPKKYMSSLTVEMQASENPVLQNVQSDPTLFCTAFKKNRFYMFTRREPEDTKSADADRDVFNEKPTKEELVAATQESTFARTGNSCIIHTSMGDIHCKLFAKECPKTIENFCVHSKKGYYNGHIFHRVIKRFMIQTGDPLGNGTGGESIWGGEFEDEFHPSLRHDRPYTLSMANAGPNTNGSQFFITVVPTPWLDNKHTVFGRVVKGLEVAQNISNVKADFNDKPYDEVKVISVTIK